MLIVYPPGIMRFLQTEWHNHERARNAWDIERGELQSKLGKQEGDLERFRKDNEALDHRIRMLEHTIEKERRRDGSKAKAQRIGSEEVREEKEKGINGQGRGSSSRCHL